MDSEPAVIETAPVTDLVLVVGPSKERIPVELAILKAASPVFASMFSPPWLESKSKEIPLPEDDPDAMRFITLTLSYHNEHELVTRPQTPQEILQIAIAVDKYDLRTALKFVLEFLFREASKTCSVAKNEDGSQTAMAGKDIVYLCAAAYVLNRCDYFSNFGLHLMCQYASRISTLMDDELISSILPAKFFIILGEALASIKLGLSRAVHECLKTNSPYRRCQCASAKSIIQRLEQFTVTYNKAKNGSVLLQEMKTMQKILDEDEPFLRGICHGCNRPHIYSFGAYDSLSPKVRTAYEELDILCVRELKNKDACDAEHARLTVAGPMN
ncbi:hypothetical protein NCU05921 [Neurospora crassa OR74A]|uniref:BTB domain-containing protein n=1 Tax=Neurospora crassa (strain ATCC 24698 / 74-OR23-1A / CBS 708.71 / DSM 1257 / FGSC 987) TaxID=367110 RepID=Q7S0Y3_NEUCR|nr:hypothetical protein NCU05921 [Neurospora crassa OR74A]EAA28996.2 hypothetical protein NCU05921 [Neurospora crassa OR74A]|eukprot:XP_958232.2 hypothetical protein NCU05921 [Neurospora crassa OR74A]